MYSYFHSIHPTIIPMAIQEFAFDCLSLTLPQKKFRQVGFIIKVNIQATLPWSAPWIVHHQITGKKQAGLCHEQLPVHLPLLIFFVTTSLCQEWLICTPAALIGYGTFFHASLWNRALNLVTSYVGISPTSPAPGPCNQTSH